MAARRKIRDYYFPLWEAAPLLILAGIIGFTLRVEVPKMSQAGLLGPNRLDPSVFFGPVMGICLYAICTFGAWVALRVEDPTRDLNWLMVRLSPARVMTDPARKERYLGAMLRLLFLMKTVLLLAIGVAQVRSLYTA